MKKILIIGSGAVGALYGIRLHNLLGPQNVRFLVDEERKERYGREGIFINGERAPFRFITPEESEVQDLVIVATKNHHLDDAIGMMGSSVGPQTTILSLLNGIESENELSSAFGEEHILYAFAVGLNSTHVDNTITYTAEGRIVFGERDNRRTARIVAIAELFERASISAVVPQDIMVELYNKFMLNTAYNTISALLGATYHQLDSEPVWRLAQAVCKEVQAVASKEGVVLEDALIVQNHRIVISLGEGKTSMAQDMEAGRLTENQWFCGTVIKLGKKHSIPTPICQTLNDLIEARQLR